MSELRAGGLAIFIAGPTELLGLQVETMRYVNPGESITLPTGFRMRNAGEARLAHLEGVIRTQSALLKEGKVKR